MEYLFVLLMKGIIVGFAIAAPVGAIGVLCIRRTLIGNYLLGVATGLGAGLADVCYAAIAAFGLASISDFLIAHEFWLKLIGGTALIYVGIRIFRTCPIKEREVNGEERSYIHAFISALFLTLTNPVTILAFVAIFAAMGVDHLDDNYYQPLALITGVAIGACGWWLSLCTGIMLMRSRISERSLIWINRISGGVLIAFAFAILISMVIAPKEEEKMINETLTQSVLDFWYGSPKHPSYGDPRAWWFQKSDATDQEIRDKFLNLHAELMAGQHQDMLNTPEGYMAQILVLDQFSRNMFRGSPQAFASDERALALAKEAIAKGYDQKLPPFMRAFLYLPFEHSESVEDQDESIRLFKALGQPMNLDYAIQHKIIIDRFGRYPHRNQILGRKSTDEEIKFLKEEHSGF